MWSPNALSVTRIPKILLAMLVVVSLPLTVVHFRSASIDIFIYSGTVPERTPEQKKSFAANVHKAKNRKNVFNRDIHLVFFVIQIPLLLLFCSRDSFCC